MSYPKNPKQPFAPQPQQPPHARQQPGGAPSPARKKRLPLVLIIAAVVVPILGMGGWLAYQHLYNWGYALAPGEVKELVDPHVDELQEVSSNAASACRVLTSFMKGNNEHVANRATDNPLEGAKVLTDMHFKAARVDCYNNESWHERVSLQPLEDVESNFQVTIRKNDGFVCMAPNFLGLDDSEREGCVMWKGSGENLVVRYEVGRITEDGGATVIVELKSTP